MSEEKKPRGTEPFIPSDDGGPDASRLADQQAQAAKEQAEKEALERPLPTDDGPDVNNLIDGQQTESPKSFLSRFFGSASTIQR